jgi:hypothetical protein
MANQQQARHHEGRTEIACPTVAPTAEKQRHERAKTNQKKDHDTTDRAVLVVRALGGKRPPKRKTIGKGRAPYVRGPLFSDPRSGPSMPQNEQ